MRAVGRKGGRGGRKGVAERLPEGERVSLRQALRDRLEPDTVVAAVEQALGGGNESARVAAVKLLADLETYRNEGDCPRCAKLGSAEFAEDIRAKLNRLIEREAQSLAPKLAEEIAQERLQALKQEHSLT